MMKKTRTSILAAVFLITFPFGLYSQSRELTDTLQASIKTAHKKVARNIATLESDVRNIRAVVSPLGEGDPIRWAQGTPGVTTGADGTTAFYVRGGNMGNNLISLDGVPIYGYSHILGLTTIIPSSVISEASISKGGFSGQDNNFTSAHLKITTRDVDKTFGIGASLNNFMAGAQAEATMLKRFHFLASARVSPLTWEYKAVKGALPSILGGLDDFNANVYDLYGKLRVDIWRNIYLESSYLASEDGYLFSKETDSHEEMGWSNRIGLVKLHSGGRKSETEVAWSYNRYDTRQIQDKIFRESHNILSLNSGIKESTFSAHRTRRFFQKERLSVSYGLKRQRAAFEVLGTSEEHGPMETVLANVFTDLSYKLPERVEVRASIRRNYFRNNGGGGVAIRHSPIDPHSSWEESLYARIALPEGFAFEATFDNLVQYYHLLEGLPVGWSLDAMIPSDVMIMDKGVRPETSLQYGAGLSYTNGNHSASAGYFHKKMDGLIFYRFAQTLFDNGYAKWTKDACQGQGMSYGGEFLYEYQGRDFYSRLSYTLSKADRSGFSLINDGDWFHARFDRRHVLSAMAQWKGFSAAMTLQSGHWENGASEKYQMDFFGEDMWTADYYSTVNNYHMPTVFRLDLGYQKDFTTGRLNHSVNLGTCNVTNHFNPFMLYYDSREEEWKAIALLPILPNFSYRIEF